MPACGKEGGCSQRLYLCHMVNVRLCFLLLGLTALFGKACTSDKAPTAVAKTSPASQGAVFRLSTAKPPANHDRQRNWCLADFPETEVFGADTGSVQRRFFYLRPGVTWLTVGDDLGRANLFLRPLPDGNAEVFTGAHFPYCLSRPDYLQQAPDAPNRLTYDNRHYIRFSLTIEAARGAPRIVVTSSPEAFYAVTAVRCPECSP